VGAGLSYKINEKWSIASGYSFEYKFSNQYSGAPGSRGRFLEKGTQKSAHLGRLKVGYSTVSSFLKKKALVPLVAAYKLTKTFAGSNIENKTRHELSVSLFF